MTENCKTKKFREWSFSMVPKMSEFYIHWSSKIFHADIIIIIIIIVTKFSVRILNEQARPNVSRSAGYILKLQARTSCRPFLCTWSFNKPLK